MQYGKIFPNEFINIWFLKSALLNILSSVYPPLVDYSDDFVIGYTIVSLVEAIF